MKYKKCKACQEVCFFENNRANICTQCKIKRMPSTAVVKEIGQCEFCLKTYSKRVTYQRFCGGRCANKYHQLKHLKSKELTYFRLFERDNFTCVYCGKSSIEDNVKLVVDHIYPIAKGGKGDLFNLITSCEPCNLHKGTITLSNEVLLGLWERNKRLVSGNTCEYDELVKLLSCRIR